MTQKRISTSLVEAFGTSEQVTVNGSQILLARALLVAPQSRIASGSPRSSPVDIATASTALAERDARAEARAVSLQFVTLRSIYSEAENDPTNLQR